MANRIGQQFGNYRLVRLLGQGGFAEVYLGEHVHLLTAAAIKVLTARLGKEELAGFLNEARTLAHLDHPHIVRVLEAGVEGQLPFVVMEYAPGGSLRQRHPKGTPLTLDTIRAYVRQVADALQYAHDQRVIHRDVKPENLLVGHSGEVLLSDFGIAVASQSTGSRTPQKLAGTVTYMAPEQLQGQARPASDQYALGIVLYEWLTGTPPFRGSVREVAVKHALARPASLLAQQPTLSPLVETVVLTALAKDPKERFASLRAFATAFEQACQPAPATAPVVPTSLTPAFAPRSTPGEGWSQGKEPLLDASPALPLPTAAGTDTSAEDSASALVSVPALEGLSRPPVIPARPTRSGPQEVKRRKLRWGRVLLVSVLLLVLLGSLLGVLGLCFCTGPLALSGVCGGVGVVTYFPLPSDSSADGITAGPDGALWFTASSSAVSGSSYAYNGWIGRITPQGRLTKFPLRLGTIPDGITAGPDGALWFLTADGSGNGGIGRITSAGSLTEFPVPISGPSITVGPDGALWFAEGDESVIGRFTTAGVFTDFPLPSAHSSPEGITTGPDGALWFTETDDNRIGRITPAGVITEFALPSADSGPTGITAGPDGNLWFAEEVRDQLGSHICCNRIGRITPAGVIKEFALPSADSGPMGITAGPDGALWFTEYTNDQIGRITPAGIITEFPLSMNSFPAEITAGPDSAIWFIEDQGFDIGRITTGQ